MGIVSKVTRALQKKRVQRALKPKVLKDYKPTGLRKYTKKKAVEKETARVQAEAQAGAKKAKRGVQPEKVAALEKKALPEMSRIRTQLKGLSAKTIAANYSGKEISTMQRKIKDPRILDRLQRARKIREKGSREWETFEKGEKHTPGQKLRFKYNKKGGTVKRKSGGKMNTDGNTYVASLYKGGKVGG